MINMRFCLVLGSLLSFFCVMRSTLSTSPDEKLLREEVDFWRRFIGHWKRVNQTPPLPRMLEALAYAERKLNAYLSAKHQQEPERDTGKSDRFLH